MGKIKAAIIGSGNIGTDLVYKAKRSEWIEPVWMVGIDPSSEGLKRAAAMGLRTTSSGVGVLLVDLTPAALGPYCIPPVNLKEQVGTRAMDVSMVSCGGQATIPMVAAV